MQKLGFSAAGYKFALSFDEDNMASYYLQRKLGVEVTNTRLTNKKWSLHFWSARWYKPLEKEEFSMCFSPQGEFLGFNHVIAEDAPGASIPIEQAQVTAEKFLAQNSNWVAADWERVEASSEAMSATAWTTPSSGSRASFWRARANFALPSSYRETESDI